MFSFINRTVFDIPSTWDRTRFEITRAKCRHARKLVKISVNGKTTKIICLNYILFPFSTIRKATKVYLSSKC